MTPRVSVVVATRNRREMLARALASVDAQTFGDFEVVVVDDASDDGTASWFASARPGDRVVRNATAAGAAASRNRGVALARGEIVAFLDDDDVWLPGCLAAHLRALESATGYDLSVAGHVEIDASGHRNLPDLRPVFATGEPLLEMLAACPIHTLSVIACRRALFARIGPFDESLDIVHDLDWYLRLIINGGRIAFDPTVLVERSVPGGLVSAHRQWRDEERAVHRRAFAAGRVPLAQQRRIRAARALLFARIALTKHDPSFAAARIAEALACAPLVALRIAAVRWRRWQSAGGDKWPARPVPRQ